MTQTQHKTYNALAITMWDFSWVERNWPGSGFENMDKALDELQERGYNAIRIDAFPHLIAEDRNREWTLIPVWYSNDWGSPYINRVTLYPALTDFLRKCRERGIKVALSSWFREDQDNVRMKITTPEKMADNWLAVLDLIREENLLDTLLYVDLCNEWPGDIWAPYFTNTPPECTWGYWHTDASMDFMKKSIQRVRECYPEIPLCYSFDGLEYNYYREKDLSFMDLVEHHIWMTKLNDNEFYKLVGQAENGRYTEEPYHLLSQNALRVYNERPDYWKNLLTSAIDELADSCRQSGKMLATTECWGIVDYKDYPLLPWGWVKELCQLGVECALSSGQWGIVATSNFACPQFVGMWQDVAWHKELTTRIRSHVIPEEKLNPRLKKAMVY